MDIEYYKGLVGTTSEYQELLKDHEIMHNTLRLVGDSVTDDVIDVNNWPNDLCSSVLYYLKYNTYVKLENIETLMSEIIDHLEHGEDEEED